MNKLFKLIAFSFFCLVISLVTNEMVITHSISYIGRAIIYFFLIEIYIIISYKLSNNKESKPMTIEAMEFFNGLFKK